MHWSVLHTKKLPCVLIFEGCFREQKIIAMLTTSRD
nr:MAG TPA: ATP synthase [Caudoviricetes sp.]